MGDSDDSVVVTAKLTKVFKDFWLRDKVTAVADLDLDVGRGEVFGLLGPNGSGKSTTLNMILGLLYPTRGRVAVFGRQPTEVRVKSRIGFLPEESYLYPFLDAWETLDFYGRLFHQARGVRRRRIEMLLDMVGLSSVAYRRVGEYSKGMQRRIGLAQALINDPDLLVVDEPTSGMDPIGTREFKDLIRTLAGRGKTVLLSSHLLADVEDVCDRVCILYGGRQCATGAVSDLLAQRDLTQITTDHLDDETLAEVRRVLASADKDIVRVSAPRDRLESLFLRIVAEARQQQLATSGVTDTGRVAEFLRARPEPAGREVIEELVTAGQAAEREREGAQPPPAPAPPQPADEVLQELMEAAPHKEPSKSPGRKTQQPPAPPAAPRAPIDRGVIRDLLGDRDNDDSEADRGDRDGREQPS